MGFALSTSAAIAILIAWTLAMTSAANDATSGAGDAAAANADAGRLWSGRRTYNMRGLGYSAAADKYWSHRNGNEAEEEDEEDRERLYLRRLLEFAHLPRHSLIGTLLEDDGQLSYAAIFETLDTIRRLSVRDVVDELVDGLVEEKRLTKMAAAEAEPAVRASRIDWPWVPTPSDNQTECTKDYSQFVDPITNKLWSAVRDGLCNNLPSMCQPGVMPPVPNTTQPDWGRKMIDAMGKIPEGLSYVKLYWVGAFDMCNNIKVTYNYTSNVDGSITERSFNGQYCRISLSPTVKNVTSPIPLKLGVCVPDTCNRAGVKKYIMDDNKFLSMLLQDVFNEMKITEVYCGMELEPETDVPFQVAVGIILSCVVLGIIGTIYDGCFRKRRLRKYVEFFMDEPEEVAADCVKTVMSAAGYENAGYLASDSRISLEVPNYHGVSEKDVRKQKTSDSTSVSTTSSSLDLSSTSTSDSDSRRHVTSYGRRHPSVGDHLELLLVAFSAYTNLRKIFSTRPKRDRFPVLNGVRYLSYAWTILGMSWFCGPIYHENYVTANTINALMTYPRQLKYQAVVNFVLSQDSFLVISGILLSYWWLNKFEKSERRVTVWAVLQSILHRYWRLIPGIALTLMFYTATYRYLAEGPLFPTNISDADNCRVNWWVDLLMVHNIVRLENMCLAWMFYVPMIFQLHVVSMIVLVSLVIRPVIGYCLLAAMYIAHIVTTAVLTTEYRTNHDVQKLAENYMFVPWCRAGPFIIGMAFGIFLHHRRHIKIHWLIVAVGWVTSLVTMAAVTFSSYSFLKEDGEMWTAAGHAAYDTLARSAWGVAVCWVILACHNGYGGIIGRFLSWELFWPLSRLAYISILTHPLMIFRYTYTSRILIYIDEFHMFYTVLLNLFYTMMMGLFFALLWHYPISIGVEKAIMCSTKLEWLCAGRHPNVDKLMRRRRRRRQIEGTTGSSSSSSTCSSESSEKESKFDLSDQKQKD